MFKSKESAPDFVEEVFDTFFDYPPEEVFTHTIPDTWDPALVARIGEALVPSRCFVVYSAEEYAEMPDAARTPHYDTPYKVEPMGPALVAGWEAADPEDFGLHLPEHNPFLPDPEVLKKACSAEKGNAKNKGDDENSLQSSTSITSLPPNEYIPIPPEEVFRSDRSIIMYKEDRRYYTPMIKTSIHISTPLAARSPRDYAGLKLFLTLFKISCTEWNYFALLGGHGETMSSTAHEVQITTIGYCDKHLAYVRRLISELCSFSCVTPRALAVAQEKLHRTTAKVCANAQPTDVPPRAFGFLCKETAFSIKEVSDAARAFTPESFEAWLAEFWAAGVSVTGIVFGRSTGEEVRAFAEDIDGLVSRRAPAVPAAPSTLPQRVIPQGCTVLNAAPLNPSNENSCISDTYYVSRNLRCPEDLAENVRAGILVDIVEPTFYEVLRTQEQLGYVVWFYNRADGFMFLKAVVQSPNHTPDYLEGRVQAFFSEYYATLKELPEEAFEEAKCGYISKLFQPPSSMGSEASALAAEFFKGTLFWEKKRVAAELAKGVTKDQIVDFYERVILNEETRRMVSVRVYAKAHQTAETPKLLDMYDTDREGFAVSKDWPFVPTRPGPRSPEPSTAGLTLSGFLSK